MAPRNSNILASACGEVAVEVLVDTSGIALLMNGPTFMSLECALLQALRKPEPAEREYLGELAASLCISVAPLNPYECWHTFLVVN